MILQVYDPQISIVFIRLYYSRRLDFRAIRHKMSKKEFHQFVCVHLVAATREARADIVRMLFQQVMTCEILIPIY